MMEEGREVFFVGSRVNKVRATQGSCVWGLKSRRLGREASEIRGNAGWSHISVETKLCLKDCCSDCGVPGTHWW